jgi:pyruvate/2-oxoglutarate dehydrogenase complex dihydrolipoamide acyltransferase (E2) component
MYTEIVMPDLGDTSAQVSVWFVETGEHVFAGDRVAEILLSGATFDVPAPSAGRLAAKLAWPNERVQAGQVLGILEAVDGAD